MVGQYPMAHADNKVQIAFAARNTVSVKLLNRIRTYTTHEQANTSHCQ